VGTNTVDYFEYGEAEWGAERIPNLAKGQDRFTIRVAKAENSNITSEPDDLTAFQILKMKTCSMIPTCKRQFKGVTNTWELLQTHNEYENESGDDFVAASKGRHLACPQDIQREAS
jgi:hypothetical protein